MEVYVNSGYSLEKNRCFKMCNKLLDWEESSLWNGAGTEQERSRNDGTEQLPGTRKINILANYIRENTLYY